MIHSKADDEIRETAALFVLGALDADQARRFRDHLTEGCAVCEAECRRLSIVVSAFDEAITPVAPPPSLRDRVLAVVHEKTQSVAGGPPLSLRAMISESLLVSDGAAGEWMERSPGVRIRVLHADPAGGRVTSLVRLEPRTWVPIHEHVDVEEVFMIEGDCRIEADLVIHAGDYYRGEAGSLHAPAFSEGGALFLTVALNFYPD